MADETNMGEIVVNNGRHLLIAIGVMGDFKLSGNKTTLSERTYDMI